VTLKTPYPPNQGLKLKAAIEGNTAADALKTPYPPNQGLKHTAQKKGYLLCLQA